MTKRQRVTDLISKDDIMTWQKGDIVTIKAGTGAGKSYFIKNSLYEVAKDNKQRILMLIHRRNCVDQFQEEINLHDKNDVIDIRTYQSIEHSKKQGVIYELLHYDYIVCDEWHFFISDASFNRFTDLSLNAILEASDAIRVFMSATGNTMKEYLSNPNNKGIETINYELPVDYKFIRDLQFYYDDSVLEEYAEEAISNNRKTIFFIQSAEKAYKLYEKYRKYSLFNCSVHNEEYGSYVDREKIDEMLKNERFSETLLITTSVFDSGVNITDDKLSQIVLDIRDTGTLLQCIGRKRLANKSDYVDLKIKARGGQSLAGTMRQATRNLDVAIHFKHYGEESTIKNFYRNINSNILYLDYSDNKSELKLNELMYFKTAETIAEVEHIRNSFPNSKHQYCDYIAEGVFKIGGYTVYEQKKKIESLEMYLDSLIGKMLFKEDREKLIEKMGIRDSKGRVLRSIGVLNAYFRENDMKYRIDSVSSPVEIDGEKKQVRYWDVKGGIIHE